MIKNPPIREYTERGCNYKTILWNSIVRCVCMYREIVVRAYEEEAKSKIDKIRNSGINMTHLILNLLLELDIEEYKKNRKNIIL